jgi:hypothetical protein
MAFPTIPTSGAGRILSANDATTGTTRTFPSLSGLTKNSGDLLIAVVVAYQTGTGTDAAFSGWTGGFTEFHDSATTTTMAIGCAYKWSTGSETGTFAVTQAGAVTGHATMIVMSIAGAHASTVPEAGGRASGTAGGATPGSLNPAGWGTEDTLWLMVGGSGETATTGSFTGITAGNPTNYTDNFTTSITSDVVGGLNASVAFRQLNAASEDPPAFSDDTSNARWGAITIGVRPVPAPPNTGAATGAVSWAGAATGTKITFVAAIDVTHSAGTPEFVVPAGVVSTDLMVLGITNADATASFGIPGATAIVGPTDTGSMQGVVLTGTGYTASDTVVFTGTTSAMIPSTFVAAWYRGAGTVGTPTSATKGGTVTTLIASDITGESATARRVVVFLEKSGSNVSSTAPTVTGVTNRAWEPWASSAAGQPSSWIGDYAEAPSEAKTITFPQSSANGLAVQVALEPPSPQGSATGTVAWVGSATGAVQHRGAAAGAVAWVGTATGTRVSRGAATGAVAWVGTATGTRVSQGAATGTVGWVGAAAGTRTPKAAATGAVAWVGAATGEAPAAVIPNGAAAGAVAWVGAATGEREDYSGWSALVCQTTDSGVQSGSASGTINWVGAATGSEPAKGAATGTVAWVGSAAGAKVTTGSATGTVAWVGAATGKRVAKSAPTGAVDWLGDATGANAPIASATGAVTWAGTTTGTRTPKASATGAVAWVGSAAGVAPAVGVNDGSATGSVTWVGAATGVAPTVGAKTGAATGSVTWVGAATGKRVPAGLTTGTLTRVGVATGARVSRGATAGVLTWAGSAVGYALVPEEHPVTLTVRTTGNRVTVSTPSRVTVSTPKPRVTARVTREI